MQAVKEARIMKGLTQVELAEQVGISQSAISEIESGDLRPGTTVLVRLADVLDLDLDALVRAAVAVSAN
jgi:transcriptional regulator with XRE-family HTH domain